MPSTTVTPRSSNYGWVGNKQRSGNTLGGTIFMGVRLYNPVTGTFTSTDPIYGGNANAYTYPSDPINVYDFDGRWGCSVCHDVGGFISDHKEEIARTAIKVAAGAAGAAAAGVLCAGTAGVGCVVLAGAMTGGLANVVGQDVADIATHHQTTVSDQAKYLGQGALGGGAGAYAKTLPKGRIPLPAKVKIVVHHARKKFGSR